MTTQPGQELGQMSQEENFWSSCRERLSALRNVPPVLKIVWESGPGVVTFGIAARVVAALLPVALAWIPKLIIDILVHLLQARGPVPARLWWLVLAEFGLSVLSSIVARMIDYADSLLANKYTRHVSIQVMKHASDLDLTAYEDPIFYDRLERARVQATDRLVMIQSIGRLELQLITAVAWSVAVMIYSPWLMLLLIAAVLPAFLGETHFAFLGYAKNFRQTPIKRQLDYLRQAGGTKEAAKELKLFNLGEFFTRRFAKLSDIIYEQDVELARKRLGIGSILSFVSTGGYYGAYAYVIWRTLAGRLGIGTFYFLTNAILQASSNIQQVFSTLSGIADQALFLTDLLACFEMKPTIRSKPNALRAPRPIQQGFEFRDVSFRYPGTSRLVIDRLNFHLHPAERVALIGENGPGKTTIVQL